jgi:pilus assembly protein Flp/PilA
MKNILSRFVKDESGATAIEYGLIAAIVGVGIIVGLEGLRDSLKDTFTAVGDTLEEQNAAGGGS